MATQTRGAAERRNASRRPASSAARTTPAEFLRQIVSELRKVVWPTRNELITYTVVCTVFVVVMATLVVLLDVGFSKLMFWVFG